MDDHVQKYRTSSLCYFGQNKVRRLLNFLIVAGNVVANWQGNNCLSVDIHRYNWNKHEGEYTWLFPGFLDSVS